MQKRVKYYLAVDIGASSGRHILSHMEEGRIIFEEIYRFYNGNDFLSVEGAAAGPAGLGEEGLTPHRIWDIERLFSEVKTGLRKCAEAGKAPYSMAIDTWGVDYVLLDESGGMTAPCYAYRDKRTYGMDEEVYKLISERELYKRTGIQKAVFNTVYQLMAAKLKEPDTLKKASAFLMVPDYLNYRLTGAMLQEYTNATTTQLINPATGYWDYALMDVLGIPGRIFQKIRMPGTFVGELLPETVWETGCNCRVLMAASHDTASAVMSIPSLEDDALYISSGTWSLLGCEAKEADCGEKARLANFTNEGGYGHRFRFLKNIMGLWMIQEAQKEFNNPQNEGRLFMASPDGDRDYSFSHLCERAALQSIKSIVNANDARFLAPPSMVGEIRKACLESFMEEPRTPWEIACVIYRSLAESYRKAVDELEEITGRHYDTIYIVGGGSNACWLNELTARTAKRKVLAGPAEASAAGCIGAQMIADGAFASLSEFRRCLRKSFDIREYG